MKEYERNNINFYPYYDNRGPWYLNVKFKKRFPLYSGKILWTLIVFPFWFLISEIDMAITMWVDNIVLSIIYFIGWSGMVYLGVKSYRDLLCISNDNLNKIHNQTNAILAIFLITATITTFVTSKGDTIIYNLLRYYTIGGFICYFTNLKIKEFKRLFMDKESSLVSTNSILKKETLIINAEDSILPSGDKRMSDLKDRLYSLKELYNDGILSAEEFDRLKKETLSDII